MVGVFVAKDSYSEALGYRIHFIGPDTVHCHKSRSVSSRNFTDNGRPAGSIF